MNDETHRYRMTDEHKRIFARVAEVIRADPDAFRPAGQWLDEHFSVEGIKADWQKRSDAIEAENARREVYNENLRADRAARIEALEAELANETSDEARLRLAHRIQTLRPLHNNDYPEVLSLQLPHPPLDFDPEDPSYGRFRRFRAAWEETFCNLPELAVQEVDHAESLARRVLLLIWLVTDRTADSAPFDPLTEFQNWEWGRLEIPGCNTDADLTFDDSEGCSRRFARAMMLEDEGTEKFIAAAEEAMEELGLHLPPDARGADDELATLDQYATPILGSKRNRRRALPDGDFADDDDDPAQPPALTKRERTTLVALATFDPSCLASALDVSEAMPAAERLSERTTLGAIKKLVKLDLAERPEGEKQGARLTIKGRRLVRQIAD